MREVQRDPEARLIYAVALLVTLPVIVFSLVRGGRIGGGATICMLIASAALVGLVHDWRRRVRLPRARVVSASPARPRVPLPRRDLVLIVEDEPALQRTLQLALSAHGIVCALAPTLAAARRELETIVPGAVLLDLGLPDGDGMELLRNHSASIPIIVVSARDRGEDQLHAIDAGARDYVPKPFDAHALALRVQVVMAAEEVRPMKMTLDEVEIDFETQTVRRGDALLTLDTPEANALALLATRRGSIVSHRQLADAMWRRGGERDGAELRLVVASLRRKLEKDPARPRFLIAEVGGYRLRAGR